jgi:hypothetical protein
MPGFTPEIWRKDLDMSLINSQRKGYRDVFNSFLVSLAYYAGTFEFPIIQPTYWIPNRLIAFSKAVSNTDYDQWIHFYEDDYRFERIWRNPRQYLNVLKRYNGVILPDFSLYRDMPLVMQLWNIYRSRAIGFWLQLNGIKVIVNIRFADKRTYRYCCDGVAKHCVIALGTHGTLKNKEDRRYFCEGLAAVIKRLEPAAIVVYGSAPEDIFGPYKKAGIKIIQFPSDYSISHKEVG